MSTNQTRGTQGSAPSPIPNNRRSQIKTLTDLALSHIRLGDYPEVEQWRRKLFDPACLPEICDELPRLLTASMRASDKHPEMSPYERRSRALAHVFENKTPLVGKTDLLPGQTTTSFVGPVVYADTIGYCIWPELKTVATRRQNPFNISDEVAERLNRDIFPYWSQRRTVMEAARYSDYDTADHAQSNIDHVDGGRLSDGTPSIDPPLRKKAGETPKCQQIFERVSFFLSDKATCVSHTVPEFDRLLRYGLNGLIDQAQADLGALPLANHQQKEMLQGVIRVLEAAKTYAVHLADAAARSGNTELHRICRKVPAQPADTLHEALCSLWICYHLLLQENTNFGFSVARFDQLLNRFYLADWQALDSDEARERYIRRAVELTCHFFLKCSDHVPLSTEGAETLFAGSGSNQALTVGGTRLENGAPVDAVNDMTYITLKATEILAIRDPNVHARYHAKIHHCDAQGNPLADDMVDDYLRRLCQVNIITRATPAIHGDVPAIEAMSKYYAAHDGVSEAEALADAHDYASIGCIEQNAAGKHYGNTGSTLFVLPAVLELTLFGGKHRSTGTDPKAPNLFYDTAEYTSRPLTQMSSMDEFIEAFRFQLDEMARHAVQNNNFLGRSMAHHRPSPFLSGLYDGPMNVPGGSGAAFQDVSMGGAKYNSSGVAVIGLADVIDSFCVIEHLVFGGKVSATELLYAMNADFDADAAQSEENESWFKSILDFFERVFDMEDDDLSPERIDQIVDGITHSPKFGAGVAQQAPYDNTLAIKYTKLLPKMIEEVFYKYRNHRGGRYLTGYWSMTNHAGFGMLTKATPNGRRSKKAFAGGITPCPGVRKRNGDPINLFDQVLSVAQVEGENVKNGYTYNLTLTAGGPERFDQDTVHFARCIRTFALEGGLLVQMCVTSIPEFIAADKAATAAEQTGAGQAEAEALAPFKELMIRVAGYSAYFVTLSPEMRQEIIDRANFSLQDRTEQHGVVGG